MDKLDRRLIQLKIEREAVKKEKDEASKKRLDVIEDEIKQLEREYADLEEIWKAEKAEVAGTQHIKEEIDKIKVQMEEAKRKGDWQKMSELQYGKLPQLEAQLKKADSALAKRAEEGAAARAHAGRRRGDRRGRVARDRHSGVEDDAGRAREAADDGRQAAPARHRPGRGRAPRVGCDPPLALRACPTRTVRTARSCSSGRPASARPS